jgi:hypothetical protein
MNSNIAIVLVALLILGTVIFLRIRDSWDRSAENDARSEYMKLFIQGFREGLTDENRNNREMVDDILRRVGYNGPEQLEALKNIENTPLDIEVVPPFVPEHEQGLDLEDFHRDELRTEEAQWGDVNLPNG